MLELWTVCLSDRRWCLFMYFLLLGWKQRLKVYDCGRLFVGERGINSHAFRIRKDNIQWRRAERRGAFCGEKRRKRNSISKALIYAKVTITDYMTLRLAAPPMEMCKYHMKEVVERENPLLLWTFIAGLSYHPQMILITRIYICRLTLQHCIT